MKCPKCNANLKEVNIKIHGASSKAISYQCTNCDYFEFEPISSKMVIEELKEIP